MVTCLVGEASYSPGECALHDEAVSNTRNPDRGMSFFCHARIRCGMHDHTCKRERGHSGTHVSICPRYPRLASERGGHESH